jgi:uncharacterized spore protein YtfJ
MTASDLLETIGEKLGSTATVKTVYGEPIHANGKTVVPIAKVAYGFGAGFGSGHGKHGSHHDSGAHEAGAEARHGEGGGGGGGVRAFPAGALEITDSGTRFVPFLDLRPIAVAFAAGALLATLLLPRRRRMLRS